MLALVTASGLIYNVGLLATPWFEGRLAQCLADILGGNETAAQMAVLVLVYIAVTLLVQAARFIKRFYVRRFANNINRRMKGVLYANLVRQSRASLEQEGAGELMIKAISDVDDCVECMRKFTTEIFDTGLPLTFLAVLLYFGGLALEGVFSSAQESLLVLFGQKMTHALRSEMSRKLTHLPAGTLAGQNPGQVAARFSGDVDTVEALFTSGIISMVADACRIVSIMALIAVKNTGLALVLLLVLPLFAVFTRHVQKRMLAAQLDNRRAVAAVSGQVPETLHNIRTIRALGIETYRERRYDRCIGDSYAAMERTVPPEGEKVARGDVALSHVTFGYGEKPVLEDFSLTVKQGEQVTLVGRTGAGKSTVFRLLLGLYPPQSGTVTIGGVDVAAIPDGQRRTCISCVEQHFSCGPGTVLEQITLNDPQITGEMARNAAKLAGIDDAIQALPEGYDTVCTDGMFSQGEWQLLSIARAAAADPAVLLDEITANLDAETEERVLDALRQASRGRTVLSVSHRVYESLGGRTVEIKPQTP